MPTGSKLHWEDVAHLADRAFWGVGLGKSWAQMIWPYLAKASLTRYQTELERCQVKIYVMVLADFYHQFCWIAYQEPQDEEYSDWAEALELSEFRIGQLMGADPDFEPDETHGYSLAQSALYCLIQEAREKISPVLQQFPGGPLGLLKSLIYYSRDYNDSDEIKSPQDVFVELSGQNLEIYGWLEEAIGAKASRSMSTVLKPAPRLADTQLEDVQLCLIDSP